jgi:hypothetical protein
MRALRLSLAGAAILVLLGGPGGTVIAQEAIDADAAGTSEVLFDIVVPPESMPTELGKVNLERQTLEPGFDASIGVGNESMRGRAAYVAEGELQITPMVDASLWRGLAATGGTPEVVVAGDTAALATGDLIYLPAVPAEELDPEAVIGLANPGTVPTTIVGFHVHEVGGGFPGWPTGMSGMAVATDSEPAALERLMAGDTTFRLSRVAYAPASVIVPDEGAAMALAEVESGAVEQLTVGPGGESTTAYGPGAHLLMTVPEGLDRTWMVNSDDPAVLLLLSVIPEATLPSTE